MRKKLLAPLHDVNGVRMLCLVGVTPSSCPYYMYVVLNSDNVTWYKRKHNPHSVQRHKMELRSRQSINPF